MATQRKDTLLRQKEIISAARELIVRYGSEHVTIRRLAKEVGITEGALYKHFKSKSDILFLLVNDIENTLRADLENRISQGDSALVTLEQIVDDLQKRKAISFQVIAEIISLGDAKLNQHILAAVNAYTGSIKHVLSLGVEVGEIREDVDLDAASELYFGLIQGLVNIWALSQYDFDLKNRFMPLWMLFRKAVEKG